MDQDEVEDEDLVQAFNDVWEKLGESRELRYASGQIERGEREGHLHLQVYIEWKKSLRLKEVTNRFPSNAEHRKADESREGRREYSMKEKTRVEPSLKQIAISLVLDGKSPWWIAINEPGVYFTHYAGINALFNAIEQS